MNLSIPILICDEREEIRLLIKTMLAKQGFFHMIEVQSGVELNPILSEETFVIIQRKLLHDSLAKKLKISGRFLIICPQETQDIVKLSSEYGITHLITFPYSSQGLKSKIEKIVG
jgi:DNA-binding NtrC family response regulator